MQATSSREPLSRAAVIETALAIGDAQGLAAVSLRRIAAELDVTPMALYRYVQNKDDLLDAMLETVWAGVELPDTTTDDWWQGLATLARSTRNAFLAHPAAAAITVTRPEGGRNILRIIEAILVLLQQAGFNTEQAARIYLPFARSLLALIVFETSLLPELSKSERREAAQTTRATLESLPAGEYPHLISAAPYLAAPYEPGHVFERGLDLLRAGIESQRPKPRRRSKSQPTDTTERLPSR